MAEDATSCPAQARTRAKMPSVVDEPAVAKRRKFEVEERADDRVDVIEALDISRVAFANY